MKIYSVYCTPPSFKARIVDTELQACLLYELLTIMSEASCHIIRGVARMYTLMALCTDIIINYLIGGKYIILILILSITFNCVSLYSRQST